MNKEKKRALWDLKVTGQLFITIGIMALIGTALFWKTEERIIDIIMNILFGIGMLFFGWTILSSRKVLA